MAFKIDMNRLGNPNSKPAPATVQPPYEDNSSQQFIIGEKEVPATAVSEPPKETPVDKALSENGPLGGLPDIDFMLSDDNVDEDKAAADILSREGKRAESMLEDELAQELQAVDEDEKIGVVVIGGNEQYFKTVLTQLGNNYPDIAFKKFVNTGGKNAFYAIDAINPDIILMYWQSPVQNALQFYEEMQTGMDASGVPYRDKYIDKRMIVLAPDDYEYAAELRAHGIQYIVMENNPKLHTADIDQLVGNIRAAYQEIGISRNLREKNQAQQAMQPVQEYPAQSAAKPASVPAPFYPQDAMAGQQQAPKPHKIIGIYSASGGSGKTVFATNLSGILAKYTMGDTQDYRVCLVEYNLACRNIDLFFNIKTSKSLAKLAQEVSLTYKDASGQIVAEPRQMIPLIQRYIERIPEIGLDVLPGISVPLEIDRISKNFTNCLFPALREMYDVVIVDMSADIAKTPMLEALNNTDEFYVIMPMDVPSIRNARVIIKFLTGMFKKGSDEIKVILNKVNVDNEEFGVDQVYAALASDNCVPEGTIPDMPKDVLSSINKGMPIAITLPEHPISQAIFSIAVGINPMLNAGLLEQEHSGDKKKSGLLGKLFGGKSKESEEKKDKKDKKNKNNEPPKEEKRRFPMRRKGNSSEADDYEQEMPSERESRLPAVIEDEPKKGFFARLFGGWKKKKEPASNERREKPRPRLLDKKRRPPMLEEYDGYDGYENEQPRRRSDDYDGYEDEQPRRKPMFPPRRRR